MQNINIGRLCLGGLVAAVVFFVSDSIVHGLLLSSQWVAIMTALGKSTAGGGAGAMDFGYFAIYDLLKGAIAMWLYVAIRPRFGAGPTTAVIAGVATWLLVVPTPMVGLLPMRFFGRRFVALWTMYALIPSILATLAGAWLYREDGA